MKAISIKCKGSTEIKLEDLTVIQGNLKDLSEENYKKLRKQIETEGFSAPFFVWQDQGKNKILDGTQRFRVLSMMRDEGYFVPPLPCAVIEAENEKQAKKKLLSFAAQFGQMTSDGLYEFAEISNIDLSFLQDMRFPEIDMNKWKGEFIELGEEEKAEKAKSSTEHECPECGFQF